MTWGAVGMDIREGGCVPVQLEPRIGWVCLKIMEDGLEMTEKGVYPNLRRKRSGPLFKIGADDGNGGNEEDLILNSLVPNAHRST